MQSEAEAMLLDRYLPQYDVTETHAVIIDADTDLTWQAVRRSDLSRSAVIRVLLEMRSLPNRLQGFLKGRPSEPSRPPLTLDDMERAGFLLLANRPATRSCSALSCNRGRRSPTTSRAAGRTGRFAAFDPRVRQGRLQHPGGALRQRARPHHDRDTDGGHGPRSLRRFARYWLLVGPFSALIRG